MRNLALFVMICWLFVMSSRAETPLVAADTGIFISPQSEDAMFYALSYPENYDASKSYPLVVFLHGAGGRGDTRRTLRFYDGASVFYEKNSHECFLLVPQCPPGVTWSGLNWSSYPYSMNVEPTAPMSQLIELLDYVTGELLVDTNRIYAVGTSMGAMGMWDLVTRLPGIFAAGVAVCGGWDGHQAEAIKEIPFWIFHGDADPAVPVQGSRAIYEALVGLEAEVQMTEFAGMNHFIWDTVFVNLQLYEWLFGQSKENGSVAVAPFRGKFGEGTIGAGNPNFSSPTPSSQLAYRYMLNGRMYRSAFRPPRNQISGVVVGEQGLGEAKVDFFR